MNYVQVQLLPADGSEPIPVSVPESEEFPTFPEAALIIYQGRYFDNYSSGYNVVPASYSEIIGRSGSTAESVFEVK